MRVNTRIFSIFVALFATFSAIAQVQDTVYFQKFDASGIDIKQYYPQLEIAARNLRDSMSQQFKSNFKVYSYGFYLMTMQTQGGLEYSLDVVKQRAEATGNYYLTICKEPSTSNIYSKFHVEFKLPNNGVFSCVNEELHKTIKTVLENTIQNRYQLLGNTYDDYAEAEIEGMRVFAKIIGQISKGNCKVPNDEDIDKWLTSEGFTKMNIKCKVLGTLVTARPSDGSERSATMIEDFAKLSIQIDNKPPINLKDEMSNFLSSFITDGTNSKFFIVKNENLYDGKYKQSLNEILANEPYYSGIIYVRDKPNPNAIDELFIKTTGGKKSEIENVFSPEEEDYNPPPNGAVNFTDLINTVRQAEDSLIKHGHPSMKDRIQILRGMYYGTPWSMDALQPSASLVRDFMFDRYLCSLEPIKPDKIFGTILFNKLLNSPEVLDGDKGVDWGHIIIGLESRLSACSSKTP